MAKDIETVNPFTFTNEELRSVSSWDEAISLIQSRGEIRFAHDIMGDGFALLDDKTKLIGVPLVFVEWRFSEGDYGTFVSARVFAKEQNGFARYIINDGGLGIRAQLEEVTETQKITGGLAIKKGLRVSEYEYVDDKGEIRPAKTFYIDTGV